MTRWVWVGVKTSKEPPEPSRTVKGLGTGLPRNVVEVRDDGASGSRRVEGEVAAVRGRDDRRVAHDGLGRRRDDEPAARARGDLGSGGVPCQWRTGCVTGGRPRPRVEQAYGAS